MGSHVVYMILDTDSRLARQNIEDTAVAHISRIPIRFVMYDFCKTNKRNNIRKKHYLSSSPLKMPFVKPGFCNNGISDAINFIIAY